MSDETKEYRQDSDYDSPDSDSDSSDQYHQDRFFYSDDSDSDYSGPTQSKDVENYRQECGYYSDNGSTDSREDYPEPQSLRYCNSCRRDNFPLTKDGKCTRCWRSICTIYYKKSPLSAELVDHVFSFVGIKINHAIRVQEEYKRCNRVCWSFKKYKTCPFGKYCRFAHVVKRPSSCLDFLKGKCRFGEVCQFTHRCPKICQWFLKGNCRFGEMCRLTHKSPKLCQWFLKGRCHFGDKCRFSHKR